MTDPSLLFEIGAVLFLAGQLAVLVHAYRSTRARRIDENAKESAVRPPSGNQADR